MDIWLSMLSLAIVGTIISGVVGFIKQKNWSWVKIQVGVAVLSFAIASMYMLGSQLGWDWNSFGILATKYLVVANSVYALMLKPLFPHWAKGQ